MTDASASVELRGTVKSVIEGDTAGTRHVAVLTLETEELAFRTIVFNADDDPDLVARVMALQPGTSVSVTATMGQHAGMPAHGHGLTISGH